MTIGERGKNVRFMSRVSEAIIDDEPVLVRQEMVRVGDVGAKCFDTVRRHAHQMKLIYECRPPHVK